MRQLGSLSNKLLEQPYFIDHSGWLFPAKHKLTVNFNARPEHCLPELLVIHNISLPPGQFGGENIENFFCNQLDCNQHDYFAEIAHLQVSSHLLIDRVGAVTQFVSLHDRAWHAGVSCFEGRDNCNDFSIGIELEGTDDTPYAEKQYAVLAAITQALIHHFPNITRQRIVGHCDIAPDRKTDPGRAFDWAYFNVLLE